ncbi:MAG: ParB/RepB/Spo0J family partition protein [Rhodococcus sp. (in: high G+C Gram-positive bacteria)]
MTDTTTIAPRLEHLRPQNITPHEKNPRTNLGDLTELTDSIRGSGVLEPLIVAPTKGGRGRKFTLIAGHRRHAASLRANVKAVPCIVRDDLTDERDQLEVMLTENLHRSDLNAVEEGNAYQALLEFDDVDLKSLATSTGHSQKTIKSRLTIAKSPEAVQRKFLDKQITLDDAAALAEFEDDPEQHARLLSALGGYGFTHTLEHLRRKRRFDKDVAKQRKQLEADGVTVFDDVEALGRDEDEPRTTDTPYEWFPAEDLDEDDLAKLTENGSPVVSVMVPSMVASSDSNFAEYIRMPVVPGGSDDEWINPIVEGSGSAAGSSAEQAAARAEAEQLTAQFDAAESVRRKFVAAAIKEPAPSVALPLARGQLKDLLDVNFFSFASRAELLGLPVPTRDDDDQYAASIDNHINRWNLEQLTIARYVALSAGTDRDMYRDKWAFRRAEDWRRILIELLGYEPADVERAAAEQFTASEE